MILTESLHDDQSNARHAHQALADLIDGHESFDLARDSIDVPIQMMPVLHQAFDHVRHTERESTGAFSQNIRKSLSQGAQPLAYCNPALEQKGADLVDHCRAPADQAGANTLESSQAELLDRLSRQRLSWWGGAPLRRSPRRLGSHFLALAEGLRELGGDQLHLVAWCENLAAEMMGANTGFHADQVELSFSMSIPRVATC